MLMADKDDFLAKLMPDEPQRQFTLTCACGVQTSFAGPSEISQFLSPQFAELAATLHCGNCGALLNPNTVAIYAQHKLAAIERTITEDRYAMHLIISALVQTVVAYGRIREILRFVNHLECHAVAARERDMLPIAADLVEGIARTARITVEEVRKKRPDV